MKDKFLQSMFDTIWKLLLVGFSIGGTYHVFEVENIPIPIYVRILASFLILYPGIQGLKKCYERWITINKK